MATAGEVVGAGEWSRVGYLENLGVAPTAPTSGKLVLYHATGAGGVSGLFVNSNTLGAAIELSDHDSLKNVDPNQHVDHTAVSVLAGDGLSGGGDISATRTLDLDINGLATITTTDGANDFVPVFDASAAAPRKIAVSNLAAAGAQVNVQNNGVAIPNTPQSTLNFTDGVITATDAGSGVADVSVLYGSQMNVEQSLGITTFNSTAFATKVTLVTPSVPAGDYLIRSVCEITVASQGQRYETQVRQDAVQIMLHRQEMKDVQNLISVVQERKISLAAGSYTFDLRYRKQNGTANATIRNAQLFFFRLPNGVV